jgi:hypothetical protein
MKTSNGTLLERLLDPVGASLNEESARKLIAIRVDRTVQSDVDRLARRCNEGELTPEERKEYETYVMFGDFIALLQAKARVLLAQRGKSV